MTNTDKTVSPTEHFINLVCAMGADSCFTFPFDVSHVEKGCEALIRMIAAGIKFPCTHEEATLALCDLDSIYWRLAAGEQTEMLTEFGGVDGFEQLNKLLNVIFDGEEMER